MYDIYRIIKQLQETTGTNDKLDILKENDCELLKKVLLYTYSPFKRYKITEKTLDDTIEADLGLVSDIFTFADILATNNINDDLRYKTNAFLNNFTPEIKELYTMILLKDLKINLGAKSINKVWKGLIPQFEVMLAKKYYDEIKKVEGQEFILTPKLDGMRCIIIKDNDNIEIYSRQGQLIEGLVEIEEEVKSKIEVDRVVLDGELLLKNDKNLHSKDLYRETMKMARKKGVKTGLQFHCFDCLSLLGFQRGVEDKPFWLRKAELEAEINLKQFKNIICVPTLYKGKDMSVIEPLLDEITSRGGEGLMLNFSDAPYECKRSSSILKIKKFQNCDVRVVGVAEGTGKNKDNLGAITIEFIHEDNIHRCDCGSGFSDYERALYWEHPELLMNKIVTIKYFEVSQDSKTKKYGLRFPTWEGIIRDDKTEISMY